MTALPDSSGVIYVVWVGTPFFSPVLRPNAAGRTWRVIRMDPAPGEILGWDDIVERAGFVPDVLVVGDKSTPPFVLGVENFPCLTVLYAVDTHIHSWLPLYAQAFDLCLVSLRDHIPYFRGKQLPDDAILWSPPYASYARPVPRDPEQPVVDLLFVGTVDPEITPERYSFMRELGELFPGFVCETTPSYPQLYAQARVVLNHASYGDLNFRVFEALGVGACLLTPRIGHGQDELFHDGRELFVYDQSDLHALVAKARELLDDPERCARVAAAGLAVVDSGHRPEHRAERFQNTVARLFTDGEAAEKIHARHSNANMLRDQYLRLIYLLHAQVTPNPATSRLYLDAAKAPSAKKSL